MQSFLKIQANQRHQIRTVEKFLDFLEVFQRFKPAAQELLRNWLWGCRFDLNPAKHPEVSHAGILSVSPIRKSVVCTSSPSAGAARDCMGWLQNTATPTSDHWTNTVIFSTVFHFTAETDRKDERTNCRCTTSSSERQLTLNSCNPVPVFSALSYPIAVSSHVEMLQKSNDGHSARA